MDGDQAALEKKFESLLQELATVGEQLQRQKWGAAGVPHYSEIEGSAHELGRRLSRAIQREATVETAGRAGSQAACPGCGQIWELEYKGRTIESVDGPTEIWEAVGYCPRCERSFFPSAGNIGPG